MKFSSPEYQTPLLLLAHWLKLVIDVTGTTSQAEKCERAHRIFGEQYCWPWELPLLQLLYCPHCPWVRLFKVKKQDSNTAESDPSFLFEVPTHY